MEMKRRRCRTDGWASREGEWHGLQHAPILPFDRPEQRESVGDALPDPDSDLVGQRDLSIDAKFPASGATAGNTVLPSRLIFIADR